MVDIVKKPRALSYGQLHKTSPATKYYRASPGAAWTAVTTQDFVVAQDWYGQSGEDIEGFHRLLKEGKQILPYTYWSQTKVQGGVSKAEHSLIHESGQESYWDGYRPLHSEWYFNGTDLSSFGLDKEELLTLANEQVQAAASAIYNRGFDGLTFASELHKTVALFERFVLRMKYYLQRGRLDKAWLEGRYGWRILLYDIEDINKLINSLGAKSYDLLKERRGTSQTYTVTDRVNVSDTSGSRDYVIETSYDLSIRGSIIARCEPPKVAFNPVTTAWELTKLSFVVDWLLDVGQWLEGLSFLGITTDYKAATGLKYVVQRKCYLDSVQWASGWSGSSELDSDVTVVGTLRQPTSVSTRPYFKVNLNAAKVADLLALFYGLLKSGR